MPQATLHSSACAGSASQVMHGTISWLWQLEGWRGARKGEVGVSQSAVALWWVGVVCCWVCSVSDMAHVSFSISVHRRQAAGSSVGMQVSVCQLLVGVERDVEVWCGAGRTIRPERNCLPVSDRLRRTWKKAVSQLHDSNERRTGSEQQRGCLKCA